MSNIKISQTKKRSTENIAKSLKKIAFIGLGKMGSAMAKKLLYSGFSLMVYNRTTEKTKPFEKLGAIVANTLEASVENADVVITSLIDDQALMSVTEAILSHLKNGAIHISTSTILPKTAKLLEEKHAKVRAIYISAPVLGVPNVVKKGKAIVFCSGNQAAIEKITPALSTFSASVENVGEKIADANVFKICMNYATITALELISEIYAFAEKSGVDTAYVQEALHHIYAHPGIQHYIDKIHDRDFNQVNFDVRSGNKDVHLFQKAFCDVGVIPDLANVLQSKFTQAIANGMENKDWSAISEVVRLRSGLK